MCAHCAFHCFNESALAAFWNGAKANNNIAVASNAPAPRGHNRVLDEADETNLSRRKRFIIAENYTKWQETTLNNYRLNPITVFLTSTCVTRRFLYPMVMLQ